MRGYERGKWKGRQNVCHKHRGRVDLVSASSLGAIDLFTWIELTAPHYDFL